MVLVTATDHSSDARLTSQCLSLLQTTVATGSFYLSLLCYHCSNVVVAMGQLPVATVAYGLLPQCLFVLVMVHFICLVVNKDKQAD
jgi:hypothetical protein